MAALFHTTYVLTDLGALTPLPECLDEAEQLVTERSEFMLPGDAPDYRMLAACDEAHAFLRTAGSLPIARTVEPLCPVHYDHNPLPF